jgi:hypothetical protein
VESWLYYSKWLKMANPIAASSPDGALTLAQAAVKVSNAALEAIATWEFVLTSFDGVDAANNDWIIIRLPAQFSNVGTSQPLSVTVGGASTSAVYLYAEERIIAAKVLGSEAGATPTIKVTGLRNPSYREAGCTCAITITTVNNGTYKDQYNTGPDIFTSATTPALYVP